MEKEDFEAKTKELKEMLKAMIEIQMEISGLVEERYHPEGIYLPTGWENFAIIRSLGKMLDGIGNIFEWWNWKKEKKYDRSKALDELVDVYYLVIGVKVDWRMDYLTLKSPNAKEIASNYILQDLSRTSVYSTDARSTFQNLFLIPKSPLIHSFAYAWLESVAGDVNVFKIEALLMMTKKLGFDFDEVYHAYIEKMKEYYERIKNSQLNDEIEELKKNYYVIGYTVKPQKNKATISLVKKENKDD